MEDDYNFSQCGVGTEPLLNLMIMWLIYQGREMTGFGVMGPSYGGG